MSGYGGLGPWGGALVLIILAAFMSLYQGLFAWLTSFHSQSRPRAFVIFASLYYCGVDYLKNWIFTGFNWTPLSLPLASSPKLMGSYDLVGVFGLTFFMAVISISLGRAFIAFWEENNKRSVLKLLALASVTFILILSYGLISYFKVEKSLNGADFKKMAVLQASVDQSYKWDSNYRGEILGRYKILATQASFSDPFLIIWSETAAPFLFGGDAYESEWILKLVTELQRPMLVGLTATNYDESSGFTTRNRAWLIYPEGHLGPFYDKRHLVPFGEYIPMVDIFPFLKGAFFRGVLGAAGNFSSGDRISPIVYQGISLGPLICFESIFPYLARENVNAGADILVVTTNDAWFGESFAPDQHFNQAVARAVETRRPLIRAANNGISGVIYPSGRVSERSTLNQVRALIYEVPLLPKAGRTLFVRGGYLLAPILAAVTSATFLWRLFLALKSRNRLRKFKKSNLT
jgi:apolipoprotein N-acyltransferase